MLPLLDGLKELIHHLYAMAQRWSHPDSFMPPRAEPVPLMLQMPRQEVLEVGLEDSIAAILRP